MAQELNINESIDESELKRIRDEEADEALLGSHCTPHPDDPIGADDQSDSKDQEFESFKTVDAFSEALFKRQMAVATNITKSKELYEAYIVTKQSYARQAIKAAGMNDIFFHAISHIANSHDTIYLTIHSISKNPSNRNQSLVICKFYIYCRFRKRIK